ncbi:hypothetical protein [Fusobacterium nucleatum]|uniref:hypothetical protein n=1 Tax=Fusobacterium nucleatum TaxID=851 RepID=UPI0030CCE104
MRKNKRIIKIISEKTGIENIYKYELKEILVNKKNLSKIIIQKIRIKLKKLKKNLKISFQIKEKQENNNQTSKENIIKPKSASEFWTLTLNLPIMFSIVYFIVDTIYKYKMKEKFYLPSEYFSIDFKNTVFYMIFSIIVLPLLFWVWFKDNKDNNMNKKLISMICIILFFFIINKLLKLEIFILYVLFYLLVLFSTFFFFIMYLEKRLIKIIILFFLLFLLIKMPYFLFFLKECYTKIKNIPNEIFYGVIILIIIINLISIIFVNKNIRKKENTKNLIFLFFIYYYIVILLFSGYLMPEIMTEKNNYEILYQNGKEVRVVIATYEDKYLIADGIIEDIEDKNNNKKILNINTDNYKFIKIEEAENIQYLKFDEVNPPNSKKIKIAVQY